MAEVRMSLEEYNAMSRELDLYKRALQQLLTVEESEWALEYFHSSINHTYSLTNAIHVGSDVVSLVQEIIYSQLPDRVRKIADEGIVNLNDIPSMSFGSIRHKEEEENEDGEV